MVTPKRNGVFQASGPVVTANADTVRLLKEGVKGSPYNRSRLCAHPSSQNKLHEMIIVLPGETYIRPHRHHGKSESFHVIEGLLDVVLYHEDGAPREVVHLGDYASGLNFFYRLEEPIFHTVTVLSSQAVIHETTNGPFVREETEFASWAPADDDTDAVRRFLFTLREISIQTS